MKTNTVNVNLEKFKQWAADCAPAAKAVLMARAHAQLERERVDAYIRPIFDRFGFVYGPITRGCADVREGQPLASEKDLYLAEDGPKMAEYFAECDRAHRAHGFTGPDGHCPALTAESLVTDTERALIALAYPLFGIENVFGENRVKYLDLLIGACIKADGEGARR